VRIVLAIIAILSLLLILPTYAIVNHYHLTTPGDLIAENFARSSQGWGPSNRILVGIAVDSACWFGILSGLCWLIQKFRS
jgi:hypothetical protein